MSTWSRLTTQFPGALERGEVNLDGYVSLYGNQPVSSTSVKGCTISYVSTGRYKILLSGTFKSILSVSVTLACTQTVAAWAQVETLKSGGTVATSNIDEIDIKIVNSSGAVTDPSVSFGLFLSIVGKNSTV